MHKKQVKREHMTTLELIEKEKLISRKSEGYWEAMIQNEKER